MLAGHSQKSCISYFRLLCRLLFDYDPINIVNIMEIVEFRDIIYVKTGSIKLDVFATGFG